MQFASFEFLIFLPLFFAIYWILKRKVMWQNLFVIGGSYLFYAWTDWYYLFIIAGYTLWSYISGILLGRTRGAVGRKVILWGTVVLNLGVLGVYKYFDFFVESFNRVFSSLGFPLDWATLNLVLPVGISFFTFQALSYTIDVYRKKISPTYDIVSFFAFLSFFPQLLAGPIERADTLLPQFRKQRVFSYSEGVEGMKRILWGLFKKMVIADNCALAADYIFFRYGEADSLNLFIGAFFFTFQIYGDFSGYSDIAVGCGKLLGIRLMENFRFPYFSRNVKEFWQRWHVSLNMWLRDYVYIPLGGSRRGAVRTMINIMIVFALSGLWHGARWTYVGWGLYCGAVIVIMLFIEAVIGGCSKDDEATAKSKSKSEVRDYLLVWTGWAVTLLLVLIGWILFKSESVSMATTFITRMLSFEVYGSFDYFQTIPVLCYIFIFVAIEFYNRKRGYALNFPAVGLFRQRWFNWLFYWGLAMTVFLLGGEPSSFIYFRF